MKATVIQATRLYRVDIRNWPTIRESRFMTIKSSRIGTATMPLMAAESTSALIGSKGEVQEQAQKHRRSDHRVQPHETLTMDGCLHPCQRCPQPHHPGSLTLWRRPGEFGPIASQRTFLAISRSLVSRRRFRRD